MLKIGPTFTAELVAAGVPLDGLSWDCTGGTFIAWASDAQRAAAGSVLAKHDPSWTLPPTVTGNQWAFALKACKVAAAWRVAAAKASDADQIRLDLISRDTPLQLDDPLLVRVAAGAGFVKDASGNDTATPVVSVPAVMACAQGMPL